METLQELFDGSTTPLWSALLLGLMTAVSPCPLATNIATVGYLGHDATNRHRVFLAGLCYTLGRVLTYTVLGMVLIPLLRRGADLFDTEGCLPGTARCCRPRSCCSSGCCCSSATG